MRRKFCSSCCCLVLLQTSPKNRRKWVFVGKVDVCVFFLCSFVCCSASHITKFSLDIFYKFIVLFGVAFQQPAKIPVVFRCFAHNINKHQIAIAVFGCSLGFQLFTSHHLELYELRTISGHSVEFKRLDTVWYVLICNCPFAV